MIRARSPSSSGLSRFSVACECGILYGYRNVGAEEDMAKRIKETPVLKGNDAKRFNAVVTKNDESRTVEVSPSCRRAIKTYAAFRNKTAARATSR